VISVFFFFLFSSPNLSGRRLDVYHNSAAPKVLGGQLALSHNFVGLCLRS